MSLVTGLLLPPGVVQPFDLKFIADDLHVIAFFDGHPLYEAVEAMVRRSHVGPATVRAILTRHDQSQIDHINDPELLVAASKTGREACLRSVSMLEERAGHGRRARVEFESHLGEAVVLDVVSIGPPDPARGGLSDPGRHAVVSSLPVMLRGASTMAGPGSQVKINGVEFSIPVKFRAGPQVVAHHGFFTESHRMGLVRTGEVKSDLIALPQGFEIGEIDVTRLDGATERVRGQREGERFRLQEVRVGAAHGPVGEFALHFGGASDFSIRIDGSQPLVSGRVACRETGDIAEIHLEPLQPDWAAARPVRLRLKRSGTRLITTTTVGLSAG